MRQRTIDALREYYQDAIDGAARPREVPGNPPSEDPDRKERVILQALKELAQDNIDLSRRVAALEAKVGV